MYARVAHVSMPVAEKTSLGMTVPRRCHRDGRLVPPRGSAALERLPARRKRAGGWFSIFKPGFDSR
jgi:hypothetical protein